MRNPTLEHTAILLPAWRPEGQLVPLVEALVAAGFGAVVVVDDGSGTGFRGVFAQVAAVPRVRVLRHTRNCGKGRALKTGTGYVLGELKEMKGLVTADADGQHRASDVVRVAEALCWTLAGARGRVVLGARSFAGGVPLRSRVGNGLTRRLFGLVTGARLTDTQTGLRGFPRRLLPELIALGGERYEYEMRVLAHVCRGGGAPMEVPIETVYLEGNRSSHFNPVWDSLRVYGVLAGLCWPRWMRRGAVLRGLPSWLR